MSATSPAREVLRPAQLNALARDLLEGAFPLLWVEGELSNLSRPASGHLYFSLKDERAQVRCALFRPKSQWLRFQPENGLQVLARGRLTLYEPRGDYQLVLDHLEPAGEGALRAAFEALKAKLQAEGLFEAARKRPLPRFVRRVGVITSPRGAAVRDVLTVLTRRFPVLEVDVLPVPVQGDGAAAQIVAMLQRAAASGRYDALLVTRGGGSLEDLVAFNDEALARAIAACTAPVVSAVGHEVDVSIADLVADLRAPTPSAAAELLTPDGGAIARALSERDAWMQRWIARGLRERAQRLDQLSIRLRNASPLARLQRGRTRQADLARRLRRCGVAGLQQSQRRIAHAGARLDALHPRRTLAALRQRIEQAHQRQRACAVRQVQRDVQRLSALARALNAVSPLATLARGYAILTDADRGTVLRSTTQITPVTRIDARLADGTIRLNPTGLAPRDADPES